MEIEVDVSLRKKAVEVTLRKFNQLKIPILFVPEPDIGSQPSSRPKGLALTDRARPVMLDKAKGESLFI